MDFLSEVKLEPPEPMKKPLPVHIYAELALHLAVLGIDLDNASVNDVSAEFDIDALTFERMRKHPAFVRMYNGAKQFVAENGASKDFKVRMRYYAELLAQDIYKLARQNDTEPSLRLKMFETITRLAELEPVKSKEAGDSGTHITISLGQGIRGVTSTSAIAPAPPAQVIDVIPQEE